MFRMSYVTATLFTLPATYATAFGFIYAYGKLIVAMAGSKLLPGIFNRRLSSSDSPYVALIFGSAVGYSICILVYFVPFIGLQLFNICMLSAFVAYSSQCFGYIMLQTKFQNLPRKFRSPLGVYGAIYSLSVWLLGFLSIAAFQGDNQFALIVFVCICSLVLVYYFLVARHGQTFSADERKILFVAHVINRKFVHQLV